MDHKYLDQIDDEPIPTNPEQFEVPVTQYMRPDGHPVTIYGKLPVDLRGKVSDLRLNGLTFGAEVLMTGDVSFTIEDLEQGADAAIMVCPNAPDSVEMFEAMVREFDLAAYLAARDKPSAQ